MILIGCSTAGPPARASSLMERVAVWDVATGRARIFEVGVPLPCECRRKRHPATVDEPENGSGGTSIGVATARGGGQGQDRRRQMGHALNMGRLGNGTCCGYGSVAIGVSRWASSSSGCY